MMSDSNINLPKQDMGKPSEQISAVSSAGNAVSSGVQGASDQLLAAFQGFIIHQTPAMIITIMDTTAPFHHPMTKVISRRLPVLTWYGIQPYNASLLYYLPGYAPYTPGFVGVDGKQAYTSPGYLQQLCSYGSEAFPCYAYTGTGSAGAAARSNSLRPVIAPRGSGKSRAFPLNPQLQQNTSRSPIRPIYQTQSFSPLNKFGFGSPSSGLTTGSHPAGKFSSLANQNPGGFTRYGPKWRNQGRNRTNSWAEADNGNNSSKLPSEVTFGVERDEYNLKEFRTEYDSAKFYVIKSYSEDDVHKCIKYDVWSSTLHGNKKLDADSREAEAKTKETGKRSPVFLFFSVNGSVDRFVGAPEMIGEGDSARIWTSGSLINGMGYFPVKMAHFKDIPNTLCDTYILDNNENRPVTYSRDTQEIGLKQGLEMLRIFKCYSEKTSVLDDFNFYEHREEAIRVKRTIKPASGTNSSKKQ
ncbi:UNVERIFIED_CONTAM: YTH domain-containing protein ECT3 [Sesamum angustifolium]|uniref:YTH domain-containing family protein n=1 Tax=Sesamum angustifolium TaxID=2727405 RepID=A0AAW2NZ98_9LAMI